MNAALNVPAWCADVWIMHQIFRNLGFSPDEIYFDVNDTVDNWSGSKRKIQNAALVSVKRGDLVFVYAVSPIAEPTDSAHEIWARFVEDVNRASDAELRAITESSALYKNLPRMELILRLTDKGFTVSGLTAEEAAMIRRRKG